jgi:CBS domain-containing protein/Zn-dependent protease
MTSNATTGSVLFVIAKPSCEYNIAMRGWSFPVGRFFGVEVRIHAFFLLLLAVAIGLGSFAGSSTGRGLTLWLGLDLRGILLLPTGGLSTYATPEAAQRAAEPATECRMAVVGPLANIGFGLLLASVVLASTPGINLMQRPWIAPSHLLRAIIWLNLLLGAINLLPAFPLDGGRVFRRAPATGAQEGKGERQPAESGVGTATGLGAGLGAGLRWGRSAGLGQWIAIALIIAGLLLNNMWLLIMGAFVLIAAHMEGQNLLVQSDSNSVLMRDVMLTQFSTLSASDTLEDALQRAVHSLQDVFPVVRGGNLVGAVSRQNIMEALATSGNSYVQGVMTRNFQTALPEDSLVNTLGRITGAQGAQLVPVMQGERIVGIVTPQNLSQSMGLLNQSRRIRRPEDS